MKPKTIDEILSDASQSLYEGFIEDTPKYKKQLIELFMSCVPEKLNDEYCIDGWNDCREQMINNIEGLK